MTASVVAGGGRRYRPPPSGDKGRLAPGQAVTWVIQGDGLHIGAEGAENRTKTTADFVAIEARVTAVRNLGETSLATATVTGLEGVVFRLNPIGASSTTS